VYVCMRVCVYCCRADAVNVVERAQKSRTSVSSVSASPPATAESGVDIDDVNRQTGQVSSSRS